MSYLYEQIQKQRCHLREATTILTTLDGTKFIENKIDKSQNIKIDNRCCGFVVDNQPDKIPASILDNFLYLGSQDSVNWENFVKYKITHILSIGIEMSIIEEVCDLKNKFIACLDLPSTNLCDGILQEAIEYIETCRKCNGRILVHCNAGVSRSASVVIGYLICQMGIDYVSAYNLVKSKRECIRPNCGFIKQLQNLERSKGFT